jgi:hypothetical protein
MADSSVAQWISRAAEAKGLVATMSDPEAKRLMLWIAAAYEGLAEHGAASRNREKNVSGLLAPTAAPDAA